MRKILTIFLCAIFLALPVLADNAAKPEPAKPASTINPPASAELNFATELKLQQQKLDFFKERLELQDKRISDLGIIIGLFGALITAVVVLFSFRSVKEAVQAAKDEARKEIEQEAGKVIGAWLDEEGKRRVDELLKPEIEAAITKVHEAASPVIGELAQETKTARELNQRHEQLMAEIPQQLQTLTQEQKKAVDEAAVQLESKARVTYQFEDWLTLGIKAYQEGKFEIATENFGKAAGVAEKPEDSALALNNKGVTLGQMGKNAEAIAVYDEVAQRYGDAPEAGLREQVASALNNKGVRLGQMGKNAEEIAVYDEVAQRYGDAPEAGLREQVASALNGKSFRLLCEAKKIWQTGDEIAAGALLAQALADIENALARKPDWPMALGNRGYILFLQGKTEQAREILAQAIQLGGDELRQGELADAAIHPLPQDEAFKALINSL